MDQASAKKRIQKLRRAIDRYRYQYHVLDQSELSEAALDSLKHELSGLEAQFPTLVTPDSPTQRVEGKVLPAFVKVKHPVRQYSFNDIFSPEELSEWQERL